MCGVITTHGGGLQHNMALLSHVGGFSTSVSTGNVSYTGVGFKPKAIIFYSAWASGTDAFSAPMDMMFGMTSGASDEAAVFSRSTDGSTSNTNRRSDNTICILRADANANELASAELVSFDTDGFTLNWTDAASANNLKIYYIAFGGPDLTNAKVLEFTSKTTTGTQAYTGVGFQPDLIIPMTVGTSAAVQGTSFNVMGIGFGKSSTERAALGYGSAEAASTSNTESLQSSSNIITIPNTAAAKFLEADLDSMDSDGFTLDWTTVSGTARYLWALCLKGGDYKISTLTQPTSNEVQTTNGVGFTPGVILASFNKASSASIQDDAKMSFGAGVTSSNQRGLWVGDKDNVGTMEVDSYNGATNILTMATNASTIDAQCAFEGNFSDGFKLDWTTTDATQREVIYFAFGIETAKASGPALILKPTRVHRVLNKLHPLMNGLVGFWSFQEMTGSSLFDLSGYGNHGTLKNMDPATDWVPTIHGGGLDFDGSNDYVEVPDSPSLSITSELTIATWVKFDAIGGSDELIVDKQTSSGNSYAFFIETADDTLRLGTSGANLASNTTITTNRWYHLAATFHDDNDTVAIYIDGVQDAINTSFTDTMSDTSDVVRFGARSGSDRQLNGQIDEIRIYNRALSAEEIAWMYREPLAIYEPYWKTPAIFGDLGDAVSIFPDMWWKDTSQPYPEKPKVIGY